MYIEYRGRFKVQIFESIDEYTTNSIDLDTSIVELKSDSYSDISGFKFGTKYITWQKDLEQPFEFGISSSNFKKFRKAINRCSREGVEIKEFEKIPEDLFFEWIDKLYAPLLASKNQELLINKEWLQTERGKNHRAFFYFLNGEIIAGNLFKVKKNGDISLSYKATKHDLEFDINPFMEFSCYNYAKKNNAKYLRKGIDYNLYGANLSTGLMNYKFKFGYYPLAYISEGSNQLSYKRYISIVNSTQMEKELYTFALDGDNLIKTKL